MPLSSKDVQQSEYLRLMVLGGPKVGKTHTVIATSPGGIYVINSDDEFSLKPAARVRDFEWDLALGEGWAGIDRVLNTAAKGVEEGRYQTVIWDTLSKYASRVEEAFAKATENPRGEPDGRRYWPMYRKHLHGIINRLFKLRAHVIVNTHYIDVGGEPVGNQLEKTGNGVVPLLGGQCRATIPAEFQDVVYLEKKATGRKFTVSNDGVWGPGCRSLPGVAEVDADITALIAHFKAGKVVQGKVPTQTNKTTNAIKPTNQTTKSIVRK